MGEVKVRVRVNPLPEGDGPLESTWPRVLALGPVRTSKEAWSRKCEGQAR